jgi:hypothetical protein
MSLREDALKVAVLKTLGDDVGDSLTGRKKDLLDELQAIGAERLSVRLPDGTKVASLPVVGGESSPRITDVAAFEEWVKKHRPDETMIVIRASYKEAVLKAAKVAGRAVDRKTGDVIPGITFEPTSPYVKVDFAAGDVDGRELIRRAWRNGTVSLPEVLALEAPEVTP